MDSVPDCETQDWPTWTTLPYYSFLTPWLLEESRGAGEPADPSLCEVCRRIDFRWLTQNPLTTGMAADMAVLFGSAYVPASIDLGSWKRIKSNQGTCTFCRLVHHTIKTQFPDPTKNPMGEVQRCGLLNESRERAEGYVIKILPSYKDDIWNPRDFEQAKNVLRFLDTGIQRMKEDGEVVGGRTVGARADVNLGRGWLKRCPKCQSEDVNAETRVDLDPPSILRLIDVQQGCLVHFSTAAKELIPEYAALSYVWGAAKQPRTTTAGKASLEVAGSLRDPSVQRVSRTVSDTIELTKGLDIPYLWVDAICIVQDDPEELAEQLAAVGWIYREFVQVMEIYEQTAETQHNRIGDTHHRRGYGTERCYWPTGNRGHSSEQQTAHRIYPRGALCQHASNGAECHRRALDLDDASLDLPRKGLRKSSAGRYGPSNAPEM